ncbi:Undecaprenyl-phosphate 4-deoxy-4-formamido-L-arabinose transferase [Acetobacteraceae bacterium EV16G]|uniref:Undecaprenyl-phosphate 4-deoxy-4-formamido-L-arabinose transferase n=1 Tax=Sorlinia euscelidii TaxID=3081148 RepID=A0ABU7U6Y3_9PROT
MTARPPVELSIIVPCFNEAGNIQLFYTAICKVLTDTAWEIIFVDDDSPDGTSRIVTSIAQQDARVRLLRRVGRRGLSSAVIEGVLASTAPLLVVMDGDMQHDESILPQMISPLRENRQDITVASRHMEGGDSAGLAHRGRHLLSRTGIRLGQIFLKHPLTDPMSGYFAFRRDCFSQALPKLTGTGFKILLEMLLALPRSVRMGEVPFVFRERHAGESKLGPIVLFQFLGMLVERVIGHIVPMRFFVFAFVGALGILVNLAVSEGARFAGLGFGASQSTGMVAAIITNFFLNNCLTYHDRPLKGWLRLSTGFAVFMVGCSLGAYANIGVAEMIYHADRHWSQASAAGAVIGVVWNYAVASTLVWR